MVIMVLIVSVHLSPGRGRFLISFSQRLLRTLGFAFVLSWSRLLVVLFLLMTLETIIFSSCSNKQTEEYAYNWTWQPPPSTCLF